MKLCYAWLRENVNDYGIPLLLRGKGHLKYLVGILMVCGGLVVTTLDCGLKGPRFQYHQQQRFVSLLGALSPASKI